MFIIKFLFSKEFITALFLHLVLFSYLIQLVEKNSDSVKAPLKTKKIIKSFIVTKPQSAKKPKQLKVEKSKQKVIQGNDAKTKLTNAKKIPAKAPPKAEPIRKVEARKAPIFDKERD
ncbi:hypothetical protein HR060_17890 [Catenovulum sp. SM1970]|uniref:hypothetical protein n=1 Tax=Marinifaba aquimaris TaxID=2741323 RepID=UPI0015722E12|nr:hypothetical protein [Marinifaba aquimaris]NTS78717.1 hypothetical protein [Marinifaba aquimaris]